MSAFNPYPACAVRVNLYGHMEVNQIVETHGEYRRVSSAEECDLYIQSQTDVDIILAGLPGWERDEINAGWGVITHFFPDDYFEGQEAV